MSVVSNISKSKHLIKMCPSREVKIHMFITKEKTIAALKYGFKI